MIVHRKIGSQRIENINSRTVNITITTSDKLYLLR